MFGLLDLLLGLLGFVGLEVDWGRDREQEARGVRTARTVDEARDLLRRIAARLEFELEEVQSDLVRMRGSVDGQACEVEVHYARAQAQIRFQISVQLSPELSLPGPLEVTPPEQAPAGAWSLGDPRFDELFRVWGDEAVALLALSPSVREYLVGLGGAVEVAPKSLRFTATRAATFLPSLLETLGALCRMLLAAPAVEAAHLASRFDNEPLAPVRSRTLSALVQRFPTTAATLGVCRRATDDPSAKIRLKAALHLGPEGRGCLRALVTDQGVEAGLRLAAARRLDVGDDWVLEQIERQLAQVEEPALVAARLLGRLGRPRSLRPLTELSRDRRRSRILREAAQQSVARIEARHPEVDHGQLSLLDHEGGALSLEGEAGQVSLPEDE